MSFRSSTWSESASSELDPLFLSLKEPPGTTAPQEHPSDSRAPNHVLSSSSGSSDTYIPIPATVNFPLPPRRLRPGEIVDITDPGAPNPISPTHQSQAPETHLTPVSLYGVAIGGNNPIQRTNSAMSGRAEVKSQNGGMTSLDLRKMSLRNRSNGSINNITTPAAMAGAPPLPPETISLRARNPSKMLAPPHLPCLHIAPACPLPHPLPLPRYQHPYGHSHSHSVDDYSRYPSTRPINPSMFPARNLSLVETPSNPIPRLPPTRQAYQSLSYSPGNTEEPYDHTIRQPLAESLSSDPNIINPHFRRHPLLASSLPQNHEASNVPLSMHSGIDQYNSRIKFAPLPAKSLAGSTAKPLTSSTAKRSSTSNTTSNSSSELLETQNSHVSKQGSMRKKSAWIHRWLLPASSKHAVPKPKQDISLPVSASLTVNATGVPASSTLVASAASALPRRNSVTDQVAPKPPAVIRARPRSRSFTAARPSLGMMTNLAHGAPSRSIHETMAAGKSILNSSQCMIVSPVRAHSLQHLIDHNTSTPEAIPRARSHHPRERIASQGVRQRKQSKVIFPIHHSQFGSNPNHPTLAESHPPRETNDKLPEMEAMADEPTKAKKKREIRFRNTLELIPDLILPDEPSSQDQALVTDPTCASDVHTELSESVSRPEVEGFKRGHKRRKTPIKNLGLFTHLRRPRSADTDCTADVGSAAAHDQHMGRKLLQSSSISYGSIHTVSSRISGKSRTTQQQLVDPPEEGNMAISSRKLAPKVNLTFVDLDHHIGSRFSVNTLLKEVHKSIPDLKPDEGSDESSSIVEEIAETHGSRTQNAPVRQYSDPVTRQELQTRSQGAEPRGTESEPRSDVPDVIFTSSDALGSPTTATSVSNPAEREPEAPQGHNSFIEVVRADGADVVFQMVVPAPCAKPSQPVTGQQEREREREESRQRHDTLHTTLEEDALTVISERLVALNKSIQALVVPPPPPPPSIDDQAIPDRKGRSHTRTTPPGIATRRKTKRIEHWLSGVPSPEQSPAPYTHQFYPLVHHNNHLMPPAEQFHQSQEVLDHPDLLDCPESPIDGLHRDLPSRLEIRAPDPAPTPA
ncbi:hypothetical protein PCANC_17549 [Puccinia coronata f. sp. avenae]|uniref:Uncharacterized protein n=1 Tax=Puccinia coronata f. sp. avenae TaxID=200324 RepID=A0A2N5U120_9BASI|nr:hypothetical protein PCANC_17549 [Puccinia coronata f. sp. avenae]